MKEVTRRQIERKRERYKNIDVSDIDNLTNIVCKVFDKEKRKITGRNNYREYVEPRQCIMYLSKDPLWVIGAYLGWRDHSTVVYGKETVEGTLIKYRDFREKLREVERLLKNGEPVTTIELELMETVNDLNNFH